MGCSSKAIAALQPDHGRAASWTLSGGQGAAAAGTAAPQLTDNDYYETVALGLSEEHALATSSHDVCAICGSTAASSGGGHATESGVDAAAVPSSYSLSCQQCGETFHQACLQRHQNPHQHGDEASHATAHARGTEGGAGSALWGMVAERLRAWRCASCACCAVCQGGEDEARRRPPDPAAAAPTLCCASTLRCFDCCCCFCVPAIIVLVHEICSLHMLTPAAVAAAAAAAAPPPPPPPLAHSLTRSLSCAARRPASRRSLFLGCDGAVRHMRQRLPHWLRGRAAARRTRRPLGLRDLHARHTLRLLRQRPPWPQAGAHVAPH